MKAKRLSNLKFKFTGKSRFESTVRCGSRVTGITVTGITNSNSVKLVTQSSWLSNLKFKFKFFNLNRVARAVWPGADRVLRRGPPGPARLRPGHAGVTVTVSG